MADEAAAVSGSEMDTDLVERARGGDRGAYALLAGAIADRFLAVARRIPREVEPIEGTVELGP